MPEYSLRLTEGQYKELRAHLFPGDGLEAVALLVCGQYEDDSQTILTTRRVVPIPYDLCSVRTPDRVVWSTDILDDLIGEVWKSGNSLVKVHCHPTDYRSFSRFDDKSDVDLSIAWDGLFQEGRVHGSAVMLPDGSMFGRALVAGHLMNPFNCITALGSSPRYWRQEEELDEREAQKRHRQAFGQGTIEMLQRMTIGVVGCSGTGSVVIEQLLRLGVGKLVLVDPDKVEDKNLNRILNSTGEDAARSLAKVVVFSRQAKALGQGQIVDPVEANLGTPDAVKRIAKCDFVFGCVDSAEGRNLLNRICSFYLIPYIDVGVSLVADGNGGISTIAGAVHYFCPGMSSLLEREVYTTEQVRAEALKRTNPDAYREQLAAKYIRGVNEDRPAVISVNMFFGALAVNEFLARIHPFRNLENSEYDIVRGDLCEWMLLRETAAESSGHLIKEIGKGDIEPLLDMPGLS
ncbi:MAG: ThiF family adenylyltransferase [Armatimonadetes bacterium]|nr:ThiF family adenylyltransferase [Armatimonadota bacterium]